MTTFIALYRGESVGNARLVAVSADPSLVSEVAGRLLAHAQQTDDPVLTHLECGRRGALRLIERETADERTK